MEYNDFGGCGDDLIFMFLWNITLFGFILVFVVVISFIFVLVGGLCSAT